jgi:catechol 2,3-dioxygenase-like lactoylglutathione lyase family enzyme
VLDHVSLRVTDYDRSKRFYEVVAGQPCMSRSPVTIDSGRIVLKYLFARLARGRKLKCNQESPDASCCWQALACCWWRPQI